MQPVPRKLPNNPIAQKIITCAYAGDQQPLLKAILTAKTLVVEPAGHATTKNSSFMLTRRKKKETKNALLQTAFWAIDVNDAVSNRIFEEIYNRYKKTWNTSALVSAAGHGNKHCLKLLLPEKPDGLLDSSILEEAIKEDQITCVKVLLPYSLPLREETFPLTCAARLGRPDILKLLLDSIPEPLPDIMEDVLIMAAASDRPESVKLLVRSNLATEKLVTAMGEALRAQSEGSAIILADHPKVQLSEVEKRLKSGYFSDNVRGHKESKAAFLLLKKISEVQKRDIRVQSALKNPKKPRAISL